MSELPFGTMEGMIEHAAGRVSDVLPGEVAERVAGMAAVFDAAVAGRPAAPLTLVIFHLALTDQTREINYVDIKVDQGKINYTPVLRHAFRVGRGFNPGCRIIYITGEADDTSFVPPDVMVVRLPLDPARLMYERVVAITAYMQSAAFSGNTAFLDSDAFANMPLAPLFRLPFDVAVTYHNHPALMTINEGVMLAAYRPGQKARAFFNRYLATYEALCRDPEIIDYYKDIRRWRGGQLSLSATAFLPGVIAETDQRDIAGALVRYLPCNLCNFFVRAGEQYAKAVLRRKYVLHLKGPDKTSLAQMMGFQSTWLEESARQQPPEAAQLPSGDPAGFVEPVFAPMNKEYNKPPFDTVESRKEFTGHMQGISQLLGVNRPDTGAVAVDDMMVWFRNVGFLQQEDFVSAFAPYAVNATLRARIWRVYMLCWAARSCMRIDGDFMDLGCYDGRTVDVMERYCGFRKVTDKTWWLYDMFENPPDEARKAGHGPRLFDAVRDMFEPYGNFRVIKGAVPDSFAQGLPEKVAFAQLDLNTAAPELAALEIIYDRIVPGGMIVFDDFGFRRYRDSHDAEMAFFRARGDVIWESPTGQGLFIKR
ncbi:TylF/MycF/NovP-related O-methyltransferase [Ferrovibrio sp.]|uniref:TylF/MycF/NovP-related O-methyltransferase n=1 Tax=Ferrovibrio sp. TaxID=1917215 RepID=UPI00311D64A8